MRTASTGAIIVLILTSTLRARAGGAGGATGAPRSKEEDSAPPATSEGESAPRETPVAAPKKPFSLLAPLPGEVQSPPRENEYELRRLDDGSGDLAYKASAFEARIHRDGSVSFRDKTFEVSLLPPWLPMRTGVRGPTLQGLLRNVFVGRPGARSGAPSSPRGDASDPPVETRAIIPAVTSYRPDPREACHYPNACFFEASVMVLGISGTFDLTEALMRLNGNDPYRVEKARFLAHTSELRVRLAARAHGDDVRKATASLRAELESIAANEKLSLAERRAIIRGLAAELDADTDEGRQARAQIEAFIKTHLSGTDAAK